MGALNRIILTGHLVADPEVRYTAKEVPVAHFRLAVNRPLKKDQQKDQQEADFINCIAWGGLAKICGEYLKKGRLVAVEGRLQIRPYETKQGQKKSATEVVVDNLQMLDQKFFKAADKTEPAPAQTEAELVLA